MHQVVSSSITVSSTQPSFTEFSNVTASITWLFNLFCISNFSALVYEYKIRPSLPLPCCSPPLWCVCIPALCSVPYTLPSDLTPLRLQWVFRPVQRIRLTSKVSVFPGIKSFCLLPSYVWGKFLWSSVGTIYTSRLFQWLLFFRVHFFLLKVFVAYAQSSLLYWFIDSMHYLYCLSKVHPVHPK